MSKLHKMVNGNKVLLTEDEELILKAEWEKNRIEHDKRRLKIKADKERKSELKAKLAEMLGATSEEIDLLVGKSDELLRD